MQGLTIIQQPIGGCGGGTGGCGVGGTGVCPFVGTLTTTGTTFVTTFVDPLPPPPPIPPISFLILLTTLLLTPMVKLRMLWLFTTLFEEMLAVKDPSWLWVLRPESPPLMTRSGGQVQDLNLPSFVEQSCDWEQELQDLSLPILLQQLCDWPQLLDWTQVWLQQLLWQVFIHWAVLHCCWQLEQQLVQQSLVHELQQPKDSEKLRKIKYTHIIHNDEF